MVKMSKRRAFSPREIIFSCTTACNLHCEHCFVSRESKRININEAIQFLDNCVTTGGQTGINGISLPGIERVGFTGGEPFLYMEFLLELTRSTIAHDLLFDQIMTNGDWWSNEEELNQKLHSLYDAGYDGKFGLSWDKYHGQSTERMITFIKTVQRIFGEEAINIQRVESTGVLREPQEAQNETVDPKSVEEVLKDIPVYTLPRTYPSDNPLAWNSKHWFKEDYCEGPGNILYVHADGNIAPCCGFANENPALFIGKITDSYETIMQNAANNKMIQLCFTKGLSNYRRFKKFPGKTSDICSFCDYVCNHASTTQGSL